MCKMRSISIKETGLEKYGVKWGFVCGVETRERALELIAASVPSIEKIDQAREEALQYLPEYNN